MVSDSRPFLRSPRSTVTSMSTAFPESGTVEARKTRRAECAREKYHML